MPITNITRRIAPKIAKSAIYNADMGTAHTVVKIAVPAGVIAFMGWFEGGSNTLVRGRVGFAGGDDTNPTAVDATDSLGFHPPLPESYAIPSWAKSLYIACPTANAKFFGTWFYD